MTEPETVTHKLAMMLRHPDDLDRIATLKADIKHKKDTVDGQLRIGLKEQQDVTRAGMDSIAESQHLIAAIKKEMVHMDRLCAESQTLIRDFPKINTVAQTQRNFELVETMKKDIQTFDRQLADLNRLLDTDETDMDHQPNLLLIHYNLTKLRDFRDEVYEQQNRDIKTVSDLVETLILPNGHTIDGYFKELDKIVMRFDFQIRDTCSNIISHLASEHDSLVVRTALIIEAEEKGDLKTKALVEARRDYKELSTRFKSIATGNRELRGYKERFIETIEDNFKKHIPKLTQTFDEKPEQLSNSLKWYFNDLNTVKMGMVPLMPKKWKIFHTYVEIYHTLLHDWLISWVESDRLTSMQMLEIAEYVDVYESKMKKLGAPPSALKVPLIDNRSNELIDEYRKGITKSVKDCMDRLATSDVKEFYDRSKFEPIRDANGLFRTKAMADMWRMLGEQLAVVKMSGRPDVAEGVIEAMIRVLTARQEKWREILSAELEQYAETRSTTDLYEFQLYLIAIANDQLGCIENHEGEDGMDIRGHLNRFGDLTRPLVSEEYLDALNDHLEVLENGYMELSKTCLNIYIETIFVIDLPTTLRGVFSTEWLTQNCISLVIATFNEYLKELSETCHPWLLQYLEEGLIDELLLWYLGAAGYPSSAKAAKTRDAGQFVKRVNEDLELVFDYFAAYPKVSDDTKERWKTAMFLTDLVRTVKDDLAKIYRTYKAEYPDTSMAWVEAVLRMRNDYTRSMLATVKGVAGEMGDLREDTIMGKVRLAR